SQSGVAVLFVSHHLAEILGLADVVTVMRDGHRTTPPPAADLDHEKLVTLMLGRELEQEERQPSQQRPQEPAPLLIRELGAHQLHDLSLDVRAGEGVGLAGLTGSGRESVALAVLGTTRESGSVEIGGVAVRSGRPDLFVAAG